MKKDTPKRVQWLTHFPVNFVRPYGPRVVAPNEQTIWKRLQTIKCEFFQRSKVVVSELAGSVEENLRSLLDKNYRLINEKKLKHFIESIQPLLESLKPLEKGSGIKIEEKHIVHMLNDFFKDDNDTLDMINEAFIIGSSLYTMSIQVLVAKPVLQDQDQYAQILPNNVIVAKNFKQNPTVKGMKRFLTETIISDSRGSPPSNFKPSQLLAELEADDDKDPTILMNVRLRYHQMTTS